MPASTVSLRTSHRITAFWSLVTWDGLWKIQEGHLILQLDPKASTHSSVKILILIGKVISWQCISNFLIKLRNTRDPFPQLVKKKQQLLFLFIQVYKLALRITVKKRPFWELEDFYSNSVWKVIWNRISAPIRPWGNQKDLSEDGLSIKKS